MDSFGALCTIHNDDPENACMPFDKKRAGTVLSDGGAMIMLESEEHALKREARILAEVAGMGQTNDADHILRPLEDGLGLVRAIQMALNQAGLHPSDISGYNCHARSTPVGDAAEVRGIRSLIAAGHKYPDREEFAKLSPEEIVACYEEPLPKELPILHGQKGNLGHSVCAAAAIESVLSIKTITEQVIPVVKNLKDPLDPDMRYSFENQSAEVNSIVKNGFVFGGINCSILFKKY